MLYLIIVKGGKFIYGLIGSLFIVILTRCASSFDPPANTFNLQISNDAAYQYWTHTDSLKYQFFQNLYYHVGITDTNTLINVWINPLDTKGNLAINLNWQWTEYESLRLKALYWIYCVANDHIPAKYAILYDVESNKEIYDLISVSKPENKLNEGPFCYVKNKSVQAELSVLELVYKTYVDTLSRNRYMHSNKKVILAIDPAKFKWVEFN